MDGSNGFSNISHHEAHTAMSNYAVSYDECNISDETTQRMEYTRDYNDTVVNPGETTRAFVTDSSLGYVRSMGVVDQKADTSSGVFSSCIETGDNRASMSSSVAGPSNYGASNSWRKNSTDKRFISISRSSDIVLHNVVLGGYSRVHTPEIDSTQTGSHQSGSSNSLSKISINSFLDKEYGPDPIDLLDPRYLECESPKSMSSIPLGKIEAKVNTKVDSTSTPLDYLNVPESSNCNELLGSNEKLKTAKTSYSFKSQHRRKWTNNKIVKKLIPSKGEDSDNGPTTSAQSPNLRDKVKAVFDKFKKSGTKESKVKTQADEESSSNQNLMVSGQSLKQTEHDSPLPVVKRNRNDQSTPSDYMSIENLSIDTPNESSGHGDFQSQSSISSGAKLTTVADTVLQGIDSEMTKIIDAREESKSCYVDMKSENTTTSTSAQSETGILSYKQSVKDELKIKIQYRQEFGELPPAKSKTPERRRSLSASEIQPSLTKEQEKSRANRKLKNIEYARASRQRAKNERLNLQKEKEDLQRKLKSLEKEYESLKSKTQNVQSWLDSHQSFSDRCELQGGNTGDSSNTSQANKTYSWRHLKAPRLFRTLQFSASDSDVTHHIPADLKQKQADLKQKRDEKALLISGEQMGIDGTRTSGFLPYPRVKIPPAYRSSIPLKRRSEKTTEVEFDRVDGDSKILSSSKLSQLPMSSYDDNRVSLKSDDRYSHDTTSVTSLILESDMTLNETDFVPRQLSPWEVGDTYRSNEKNDDNFDAQTASITLSPTPSLQTEHPIALHPSSTYRKHTSNLTEDQDNTFVTNPLPNRKTQLTPVKANSLQNLPHGEHFSGKYVFAPSDISTYYTDPSYPAYYASVPVGPTFNVIHGHQKDEHHILPTSFTEQQSQNQFIITPRPSPETPESIKTVQQSSTLTSPHTKNVIVPRRKHNTYPISNSQGLPSFKLPLTQLQNQTLNATTKPVQSDNNIDSFPSPLPQLSPSPTSASCSPVNINRLSIRSPSFRRISSTSSDESASPGIRSSNYNKSP